MIAVERASTFLVVEAETILAFASWAWPMGVFQESAMYSALLENVWPVSTSRLLYVVEELVREAA